MKQRPRIFDILEDCDEPAADQALVVGALHVCPEHQREALAILLKRGRDVGFKALPALYHKLGPEAQALVVANASRLSGALRATIRSRNSQTRINTLDIIRSSGTLRLAYLAALAMHDGSPAIRGEAATTILEMTNQHCRNYVETTEALRAAIEPNATFSHAVVQTLRLLLDERRFLVSAIKDAVDCYESHHRPEVVKAAMYLAEELEKDLFQQSTLKRGKLTHTMLETLSASFSPRLVPFMYIALCYPELRRHVVAAISPIRDPEFFAEFIRHHWLARDPVIRKNLTSIRNLEWLQDGLDVAFSLPEDVAAMAPAWLMSLGVPSDQKVSLLLSFMLIDCPEANRSALLALVQTDTPTSTIALHGVLDHEDPALVRIAQHEIEHRERRENRLIGKPRNDRPEAWSQMLSRSGLTEDFDDFWKHFDRLHPAHVKSAGHYASKYVPGFSTQVQVKLLSTHAADRLRALKLIMALHSASCFQRDVFASANDPVPEVRAAAMTALGGIGEATSRRILERGLGDDHPLVQTNAIEALDAMNARHRAQLIVPKIDSEDANVRAAAIRVLLRMRMPQGAATLISMLQDTRVEHRFAALWIVDQMRLTSVASRIEVLEQNDPDPRIARIALHVGKRLRRQAPLPKTEQTELAGARKP